MSEASRRSRVTITLGRSGQVVSRDGTDIDELPRVGTKRSVKERLGNQFDSSSYGSDAVSKRQRGEASFSGNDLQISQHDLRFKLLQKNAQRRTQSEEGSTIDLREMLLSKSKSEQLPRSLDARPRMADPRDDPRDDPLPPSRTARGPSQMLSSSSAYSPWARDDTRRRSPERLMSASRGRSPPRNGGSISGTRRSLSPPRSTRSFIGGSRGLSPPRSSGRMISHPRHVSPPPRSAGRMIGHHRDLSPPRSAGRIFSHPRDMSPPRNAGSISGTPRALSPSRNTRSFTGGSRGLSPPRNDGRMFGHPRDLSPPPRTAGRMISSTPRELSPPRNPRSFSSGSRALSPTRNVGSSYMGSSRGFSPSRNPGSSYVGSSRGSPPPRSIDDFHGRSRMVDDVRPSPYAVRGVVNNQAPGSGITLSRTMLPPPVPNPHPLPPLSQLPPLGSMMQNSPFPMEEPLTVESFLNSLGLGKYFLAFKREEVDMTTIKQMKESDLKDLIIPMGPRKKILQAIACLPKR
ncbi:serine/arginine repetitive matrix protein 1 [Brassica napus]|uniref:serine/arginine repetitive matrix protein 1 n=1 Tax=Brassica napus TaxID=3708 RepID=UPI0006AB0C8B|nr:serine/arginine repetitive matrix protein 1 [Brassica napus]XP_048591830.1 serine/arginine repetitive matrix protein 1 [Brassica napus]